MERREIEAFLTLAEELHFGRTAERLRLTSARISQTIQQLEGRIGSPLFNRSSRQVSLTLIGQRLRDDLIPHYRGIQEAEATAISAGREVKGMLSVGFRGPMVGALLVEVIDVFRGLYPGCEVRIREIVDGDRYGPLRRGEVDVLIAELPVDRPDLVSGPVLVVDPLSYGLIWRSGRETSRIRAFSDVVADYLDRRASSAACTNGTIGQPQKNQPIGTSR